MYVLSREPLHVFKGEMPRSSVQRESINVPPKLIDGVQWLLRLERETTNLVVYEAGNHLELHGTIVAEVHVLEEIVIGRAVHPEVCACVCVCVCVCVCMCVFY